MTPEERDLMISMGKTLTAQGEAIRELQNKNTSASVSVPISIVPSNVSVVDHEGLSQRFKMEVGFEQGAIWTQEKRMEHSMKLLIELEDLLKEYGVVKLHGNYSKHGF